MKKIATPAVLALMLLLSACISGKPQQSSYTSPSTGTTTAIQSDREMCENSCNEDYNRCMDTRAASQDSNAPGLRNTSPPGIFGASGQCRTELSGCLPGCKGR